MKDNGKLLYRKGNAMKRPNDGRLEASLETHDEWDELDEGTVFKKRYSISEAELVMLHTIANNPNDQVCSEDFENESAIDTLPNYGIIENYLGKVGRTVCAPTDDYYAGDGTQYEAGRILRAIGADATDLELGFTNA
ncbi:hypothetical protein [uncultured Sulfitobacter sp.]|uniref:hypothetical protein n=1 Tax=uncultured Sulfitobacter sp. TaxID=191468 RepID=UPI00261A60F1|nr:hypothetical protein [uncultured Sulfitobacter sp.]